MKITITYKIKDSSIKTIYLTAEEYFDPIEDDETFEDDAIPKFDHAEEYLDVLLEELEWTELKIVDLNNERIVKTDYLDSGKSWMTQIRKSNGYEEIILNTKFNEVKTNIVRIHKNEDSQWQINVNSIIEDLPDGSQKEDLIF